MKPFAAIVLAVLLMACLTMSGAALESKVFTLTEKTLSMNLGPG
jgi:hypothetical protein